MLLMKMILQICSRTLKNLCVYGSVSLKFVIFYENNDGTAEVQGFISSQLHINIVCIGWKSFKYWNFFISNLLPKWQYLGWFSSSYVAGKNNFGQFFWIQTCYHVITWSNQKLFVYLITQYTHTYKTLYKQRIK